MKPPSKNQSKPKANNAESVQVDPDTTTATTTSQPMASSQQQYDPLADYPNRPESGFSILGIHSTSEFIAANLARAESEYDHLQMHDPFYPEATSSNFPNSYDHLLTNDPHLSYHDRSSLKTPPNIGQINAPPSVRWYENVETPVCNSETFNELVRCAVSISPPIYDVPATSMYPYSPGSPATTAKDDVEFKTEPSTSKKPSSRRSSKSASTGARKKPDGPAKVKSNSSITKKKTSRVKVETTIPGAFDEDACKFEFNEIEDLIASLDPGTGITPALILNPPNPYSKTREVVDEICHQFTADLSVSSS